MRSVRSIIRNVLRDAVQETAYSEADSTAYDDAFDYYVDMLIEYDNMGIDIGYPMPRSIDDEIGTGVISNSEMASLLLIKVSSFFAYQPTFIQKGGYEKAYENLMAAQPIKSMKPNGVPSTYPYYDRNPVSCCNESDCDCEQDNDV